MSDTAGQQHSNKERFDLKEYFQQEESLREQLKKVQERLDDHLSQGKDKMLNSTTGDPLSDEIMLHVRADKETVDAITAFNKQLIVAPGIELLLVYNYSTRVKFSSRPDPNDYTPTTGYVFGILSGQRLSIEKAGDMNWKVTVPFSMYTSHNCEEIFRVPDGTHEEALVLNDRYAIKAPAMHFMLGLVPKPSLKNEAPIVIIGQSNIDNQKNKHGVYGIDAMRKRFEERVRHKAQKAQEELSQPGLV